MHFKKNLEAQNGINNSQDSFILKPKATYNVTDLTLDFNNLLPKSLINDLNSVQQDQEEDTTGHTDRHDSISVDTLDFDKRFTETPCATNKSQTSLSTCPDNYLNWGVSHYSSGDVRKFIPRNGFNNFNTVSNPNTGELNELNDPRENQFYNNGNLNFGNSTIINNHFSNSPNNNFAFPNSMCNISMNNMNNCNNNGNYPINMNGFYNYSEFLPSNFNNYSEFLPSNLPTNSNYMYHGNPYFEHFAENRQMNNKTYFHSSNNISSSLRYEETQKKNRDKTKKKSSLKFNKGSPLEREDFDTLDELLSYIKTDLSQFVKTQKGSRTLQKVLDRIPPEKLFIVLENLKNDFSYLMTDTYGNYLCQKLIQCCSAEQRVFILRHIMEDFSTIACNPSGTHSLQSLIEIVNMKEEEEVMKQCVKDKVVKLSLDTNGTHVMQKVVSCLNERDRSQINKVILDNFYKLVFDSNGICVLKKFINGNESPEIRKLTIDKLQMNALEIIQNPFGNYIIQHVFDEWGVSSLKEIMKVIITNVISLSMQKFSSNVVEKCLDISDVDSRNKLIREIFNASKISSLIKNKYGNFVLQKAISILSEEEKKLIKEDLVKKVNVTSNKEKARLTSLIENM